jgi:hypothetical protein
VSDAEAELAPLNRSKEINATILLLVLVFELACRLLLLIVLIGIRETKTTDWHWCAAGIRVLIWVYSNEIFDQIIRLQLDSMNRSLKRYCVRLYKILIISRPCTTTLIFRRCIVSFSDGFLCVFIRRPEIEIDLRLKSDMRHIRPLVNPICGIFDPHKSHLWCLEWIAPILLRLVHLFGDQRWSLYRFRRITLAL